MAILCLIAATSNGQAGEIYKSVDANGNVVYSDHVDSLTSQAVAVQPAEERFPPHEMHLCGTTNCFTLVLDNGSYRRIDGIDDTWTVETFTANSVVLHRHGVATGGTDVTYAGDVANDRLLNVTVNGKPTGGIATGGIDASWGSALNTLPGSNAERDADNGALMNAATSDTVTTAEAPPPLPAEDQSALAEPGYLWTPGYWYWRSHGYFWVPGAWVRPPQMGVLWTPGYWALVGGLYAFHRGYWGTTVGFYGGINYGYGYFGTGYNGGHWKGDAFYYNNSVNRLSAAVKNTYAEPPPNQASRVLMAHSASPHATPLAATARHQAAQYSDAHASVASTKSATAIANTMVVGMNETTRAAQVAPRVAAPPKINHATSIKAAAPIK